MTTTVVVDSGIESNLVESNTNIFTPPPSVLEPLTHFFSSVAINLKPEDLASQNNQPTASKSTLESTFLWST
jgi:hypothetical protein